MTTDTLTIGDQVEVYSDYHGYYYITNVNNGVLVAQDDTSFTVTYITGGKQTTERFDDLDNYHLEPAAPRVKAVRRCVECGLEVTGSECQWCGGF